MRKVSAFCPAYVTGIFTIGNGDAAGAGFSIDKGMTTAVCEASGKSRITINGQASSAKVSKAVLRRFSESSGKLAVAVSHSTPVLIGYGMGMSAAGALSLCLALNELAGAGLSRQECVKIAHDSEVECGTGLSGADAAAIGGLLAQRRIGEQPVKIPMGEIPLEFAFYSPIRTASVIGSPGWKKKVNAAGESALSCLFKEKGWEAFVEGSREFACQSGLGNWCKKEMLENRRASMAMLGKTLFSDSKMGLGRKPVLLLKAKAFENGAATL